MFIALGSVTAAAFAAAAIAAPQGRSAAAAMTASLASRFARP
jgi:hypothetical protein